MDRLKFGAFLAPHHPIGEHPMPQFRRDLDFVEHGASALGLLRRRLCRQRQQLSRRQDALQT